MVQLDALLKAQVNPIGKSHNQQRQKITKQVCQSEQIDKQQFSLGDDFDKADQTHWQCIQECKEDYFRLVIVSDDVLDNHQHKQAKNDTLGNEQVLCL